MSTALIPFAAIYSEEAFAPSMNNFDGLDEDQAAPPRHESIKTAEGWGSAEPPADQPTTAATGRFYYCFKGIC